MPLSVDRMLSMVKDRTGMRGRDPRIVNELDNALTWLWERLYVVNPNLELTFETTGSFSSDTQTFDLGAAILSATGGEFYGLKTFWVKRSGDAEYIPVDWMDTNRPAFIDRDQDSAQVRSPVLAQMVNFDQIRFSPALPSGAEWRADWIGKPASLSLSTNAKTTVPDTFGQALMARATAVILDGMDEERRSARWFGIANSMAVLASQVNKRRQFQNRTGTRTYPPR